MAEKLKSLTLTKSKIAEVEGEHRVTFIASTATEDRDYEHVQISTFRLPLKGGGHIVVSNLPAEGADNVDVPLLTDHDLYSVDKVIGSVRRAYWDGTSLIFEAGISSRDYAQDVFKLLSEGHLDNAFSIQYRDYQHDQTTNSDYNGEIVEVSLVTRGSNMDAHVLAVKGLKEEAVEEKTTTDEPIVESPVEAVEAPAEEPKVEEETKAEDVEVVDITPDEPAEAEAEPETTNTNEKEEPEMETPNNIAKTLVKEATQAKSAAPAEDYLKTKGAVADFAKTIVENGKLAAKAWMNHLASKGIAGDAILPSEIENIFFKAWEDNPGVLSTFGNVRLTSGALNAFTTESRALGHKKGEAKANQTITNIRRDIKAKIIYKKLPIDLQDLIDDTTGELLRFRVQELADRVANEIVVSAILGDGRSEGTPDYRTFDGTRGLFSIAADLAGSSSAGSYASAVATSIANVETDDLYAKIVKTINAVKGDRKVVILPQGSLASLLLTKLDNGNYMFPAGVNFEQVFGARIFELPEMVGAGYDVIAYADGAYKLFGTGDMVRTDFDLTYNQDIMLVERAVAGSLAGNKVAAGYVAANASA